MWGRMGVYLVYLIYLRIGIAVREAGRGRVTLGVPEKCPGKGEALGALWLSPATPPASGHVWMLRPWDGACALVTVRILSEECAETTVLMHRMTGG